MKVDIVIRGGTVVDGSGEAEREADVAIRDGNIVDVGALIDVSPDTTIDAAGKLVVPGFIDAHGHSDVGLYMNPGCESKLAQGITTEVMGNCGYSPFPLLNNNRGYLLDPEGVELKWSSASEYFATLRERGFAINAVPQVGHITVRAAVLDNEDRPATRAEIGRMKDLVDSAMSEGACGFSTGLDYNCSTVADLEEIVDLATVAGGHGGFYSSHLRGYSRNVLNAVAEAIEVGRRAGTRVQLSHLGVFGRQQWGFMARLIDIMDAARESGVQVACDMMPYRTKGSWWGPRAIFPADVYDWKKPWAENLPGLRKRLSDPEERARLAHAVEQRRERPKYGFHEEFVWFSDWRDIYLEELPATSQHRAFLGASIAEMADKLGTPPVDLYFDLILQEGDELATTCIQVSDQDFLQLMGDAWTMFGTDAIATEFSRLREPWNTIQPHPRHYGTFPRVLATFVRDERRLTLPEAVRRMTGLVADHFELEGRGYVREGCRADLVVVDPEQVGEQATWRLPNKYPSGINAVLVNGATAVSGGTPTGALAGEMLTRTH